ncbi:MAG: CBM35 domain-containing protein [Sedimentisphaerales bacterium]
MKRTLVLIGLLVSSLLYPVFPVSAVDGFGRYTTGGADGTVVTVTTAADLASYVGIIDTPYIIQVSGTIDLNSLTDKKISIRSNKTIRGIGENPTIIGSLAFKKGSSNVIIERLNITAPNGYGEGDGISVKEDINNVFITKCTIYNSYDSCLDITRRSDWVTVSWCKFYFTSMNSNNDRVTLIGSSDDATDDSGKLHVTFHHNWYGSFCWQRIPSVRFGRAHIYNNYYNCPNDLYCVRTRLYAECLVENNYFKDVQNPWERYVSSAGGDPGKLYAAGNILDNVTWNVHESGVFLIDGNDTVFEPNYSYTLDDANDVPAIVQYGAGADGKEGTPPHWFYGPYGDFDRSGFVGMNDFSQFVGYWLVNDCNQLSDADYNGDCIVNFYEFALFAENWLYIPPDITPPAAPTGLWAAGGNGTVSLDWANNNESDLAGYNIYRSTTSGSGWSKLNGSLLSDSNYIDNSVVNGTMYYYVVTATDTSSEESGNSVQACAVPDSNGNSVTLQENATGFCSVNGKVENEWAGYTGAGYANTDNALGNGINWKINVPSDGNYTFVWRYALLTGDRTAKLIVNGTTVVPSISFPYSGAVTTYIVTSPVDVNLTAGIKDIRLEATTADGLGNIDYMKVTGNNPAAAGCN